MKFQRRSGPIQLLLWPSYTDKKNRDQDGRESTYQNMNFRLPHYHSKCKFFELLNFVLPVKLLSMINISQNPQQNAFCLPKYVFAWFVYN